MKKLILPFLFLQAVPVYAQIEFVQYQVQPRLIDLNDAMSLGESYSFAVKTAISEQNNAQWQKDFAILEMGPSLSATGNQSYYDKGNTFSNVNNHGEGNFSTVWSVTATQPVIGLIPGAIQIGQTLSLQHAADANVKAQRIAARVESARAYILVQQALRTLEAKKAASKSADEIYKQAQVLFDTGSVEKTKVDVLQTKAEAATARLSVLSAQKDLQSALIYLGTKIGIQNVDTNYVQLEKISVWEKIKPTIPNLKEAIDAAIQNRPEIQVASENYSAAKLKVYESHFSYMPQVNLFATYSMSSNDMGVSQANGNVNNYLYGVNLNWSIWDGGVQAAAISANTNERTKAMLQKEQIDVTVKQDVQNSLNDLNSAIKSLADAKDAAESYEKSYKLATIQYKTGDYSAINLIETQNKMTAAQVALANVRSDLDLSWMKLQAALGEFPHITKE